MAMRTSAPASIDEYIAASPAAVRPILKKIRRSIRTAAPGAEELISYRMPAFRLNGILVYFAAFKNHIGLYPPVSGDARLEKALAPYAGPKGNLKFPLDRAIPYALIRRIVLLRVRQNLSRLPARLTKVVPRPRPIIRDRQRSKRPMSRRSKASQSVRDSEQQLKGFIAKFESKHQALIRAVRKALRARFPTAYELAYDNYNFLVLGYGPTDRPSDCIISMAAAATGIGLCFIRGAALPDPDGILLGSGKQTRFVRIDSKDALDHPAVKELIDATVARSKVPMRPAGRVELIIRSVSAKQRPRRKKSR